MHKAKAAAVFFLAALFFLFALPTHAAVFCSDVRVLLSLGKQKSFSFTPVGKFTLKENPSISVGNDELIVSVVGGRVSVTIDGTTTTAPSLTFLSDDYGGKSDYIRLRNAEHSICTYLGNITFDAASGVVRAINTLPIEQYLYGVVPHEMSNSFPIDALKAQAVCARGYAVSKCSSNGSRAYDLLDTSADQEYRGYASRNTRAIAAVDATAGQVLTYNNDIIETYYSASNGGQTEKTGNVWTTNLPYYINEDDPFDLQNASSLQEKSFIPEQFTEETLKLMDPPVLLSLVRAAHAAAGTPVTLLGTVQVKPTSPSYPSPSRAYTKADITLTVGYETDGKQQTGQLTVTLTLSDLRFGSFENSFGRIGATKTRLRLRGAERGVYNHAGKVYTGWYLTERRYGHGVGLSQRGAQERARQGQPYTSILSSYYANTTLVTVGTYETAPALNSVPYKISKTGISGISIGTSAEKLLSNLSSVGNLSVVTSKGAPSNGNVCTGYFVRTIYSNGSSFFDLPIVLFGDVDGNGQITENDVFALQNHLLRQTLLTGARLSAADTNHDGSVNLADLLRLIQCVNSDTKISQAG